MKPKIIRATTIPGSLNGFCRDMLKELSITYDVIALSSPGPDLDEIAQREGVRTIAVPMERRPAPLKDFISLCRLIRTFRKERPDIVHSMTPKAGLLCMMAAWITRVPIRIHTFTGLVFPTAQGIKKRLLIFTDKLTCACATHIIPEGEGVKNDLINYHITQKSLQVLGFGNVKGVDVQYFAPSPIQHKKFTFLFLGRIVNDKGIKELVDAFAENFTDAELILLGGFEIDDPILDSTLELIHHQSNIHLVPATKDVRPFYNQADCLVLPSYREGFPNVVLEAGAMELPCIVTNINGSREVITNNINGLIVPSHNVIQLREAMKYMVEHPQEAKQMGKNARPIIIEKFEQSFVRQCLYDYYKQITSSM